ncbi:hypothetical protein [Ruegeria sp. R14_0]|uniref:hypothetical protein n=1 Tax=Ruegeria sp. R14_0 TaxID=2821100 RepID=UPI001ADA6D7E|nr:hypothetical protein [Ruegeria sp. R14_0]MBO9446969.1 hypothetical protein [Ruegeria sp. R14_0]
MSAGLLYAEGDMVKSFAGCAGRFSAEMEHAWLLNDAKAQDYELRRGGFVSLLEATTTAENAEFVLSHRVNSKHAHARLLQTATFGSDKTKASAARRTAKQYLDQCNLLILGGA